MSKYSNNLKNKHLNSKNLRATLNLHGIENLENLHINEDVVCISDLILWSANKIESLESENNRLAECLTYLIESGSITQKHGIDRARSCLGLEVENK